MVYSYMYSNIQNMATGLHVEIMLRKKGKEVLIHCHAFSFSSILNPFVPEAATIEE